jgi:hypothetical protein
MNSLIPKTAAALLAVILVLSAGCQSASNNTSQIPPTTRVALLFSAPTKSYVAVGTVSSTRPHEDPRLGYDNSQTWQNELQKQAAVMGADAVIVNMATVNNAYANLITGTAIRYQSDTNALTK